jgi:hypothetical protein
MIVKKSKDVITQNACFYGDGRRDVVFIELEKMERECTHVKRFGKHKMSVDIYFPEFGSGGMTPIYACENCLKRNKFILALKGVRLNYHEL